MKVFATRHFSSALQRPRPVPDGTSLQELMNAFLATLAIADVADVTTTVTSNSPPLFCGVVVYQMEA